MAKSKYNFIKKMIIDKSLNQNQRERILDLASKELDYKGSLEERVKKIEKILTIQKNTNKEDKPIEIEKKDKLPKFYHNPNYTYHFLREYNEDFMLSTTCHLIDNNTLTKLKDDFGLENYDFNKHYCLIKNSFSSLVEKYTDKKRNKLKVDYKLIALIRGYLTGENSNGLKLKDGWGSKIMINWGMDSLSSWATNNPEIPPNPDRDVKNDFETKGFNEFEEFRPKVKLVKIEDVPINLIQNFNQLVYHFKYLFHIRADNNLRDIIENNIVPIWGSEVALTFEQIDEHIEYFLDVDKLIQAINNIFKLILEIKEKKNLSKPEVVINFYSESNDVCFAIQHKNTHFLRRINEIDRPGGSFSGIISNQINGMGEFEVEARLPDDKSYKIKYWDFKVYKDRKPYYKQISTVKGVKYIIRMKKS